MSNRPAQWGEKYASIFRDESVVVAYAHRPPYPPATFAFLVSLVSPNAARRTVLDAGCGTGFITRELAPHVDHITAVDISAPMVAAGQRLPGGDRANITWIAAPVETAPLHGPYALIVAASSLHWMDWDRALPRFAAHLVPEGVLAIVENPAQPHPWDTHIRPILGRYSLNTDFSPYDMTTVVAELEQRGLFRLHGTYETEPILFRQPIAAWVEAFHARNGFSRDRLDPQAAQAFDAELLAAIEPYCPEGVVGQHIIARILWGKPLTR